MPTPELNIQPNAEYQAALTILQALTEAGYTAYLAGGCVRDMLLSATPKDYDIATDATPNEVRKLYPRARRVGEAFGVMLVHVNKIAIEVATFRKEWGYSDGRRPDKVEFTNAQQDAARRDFTINGLFYDPIQKQLHDYVDGQNDLKKQCIRAIGNPDDRFSEDYLRMLRAVRFAARLNFALDPGTHDAIIKHAEQLNEISRERIGMEIRMMLTPSVIQNRSLTEQRTHAFTLLQQLTLDAPVLKEKSQSARNLTITNRLFPDVQPMTALTTFLYDRHLTEIGKVDSPAELINQLNFLKIAKLVRQVRGALMLSNDESHHIRAVMTLLPRVVGWAELDVAQRKRLMAEPVWNELVHVFDAVTDQGRLIGFDHEQWVKDRETYTAQGVSPTPFLSGQDLIELGLKPGPKFKALLDDVYDAQLRGEIETKDEAVQFVTQHHQ